jgi:SRSO17 transposase
MNADQLRSLQPALRSWIERFRVCFKREATFEHFECYLLGLMAELKRKSIEPIALAAGVAVRTLQEFLAFFAWDHARMDRLLVQMVANRPGQGGRGGIVVLDASGHAKRGDKTPGVRRQYCGETGKLDNCVVGQHLLYTDNDAANPFCGMLASDLFLPECWDGDRERCREAGIPDEVRHRPKWEIALHQLRDVIGAGLRPEWAVFDEDYGRIPAFWFGLDALGQNGVGEVPSNFRCWIKPPACTSTQYCHAARQVDNLFAYSPAFREQEWKRGMVKDTTRGPCVWEFKAARVHLPDREGILSDPTDRMYWLIVMRQPESREIKYVVSNAGEREKPEELVRVLLSRWHVEKWFERAKQEVGLGAFEVRTYTSLIRHWLCCRIAMAFLADQTTRLRGEKPEDHLRAGGGGGEHIVGEDLAHQLALVG